MDKQGIFRMEGNANTIQELKDSFDTGIYIEFMKFEDVNNVTSLLKLWLRSLPTPILSNSVELLKAVTIDDEKKRMDQLRELIHQIPHPSFCVCACIIRLCDLSLLFLFFYLFFFFIFFISLLLLFYILFILFILSIL